MLKSYEVEIRAFAMMDLPSEVFAIALHPTSPLIATALLEGHVSCYKYDVGGPITKQWHTKRHKGSCRGLEFSPDGTSLVSVGKDAVIKIADAETGKVIAKDTEAHIEAIDAVKYVNQNYFVTGDDAGIVKVWDTRTLKPTQTYPETHIDHITSFLPLPNINSHHVLCTSGDCTVSIFDLRKPKAVAVSEDQEDEPLCSAFAGDSRRICVGTQGGFVTIWKSGEWMDHVDRIAPADRLRKSEEAPSVDCMVQLDEGVIVGTSDGVIRRLGFRPNRYGDVLGRCEDVVTSLSSVPDQEGWIVSASGTGVKFWNTDAGEQPEGDGKDNEEVDNDDDNDSSEEEKPQKRRKKSKKVKKSSGDKSAFFADL